MLEVVSMGQQAQLLQKLLVLFQEWLPLCL
jgi:hypothetical protein